MLAISINAIEVNHPVTALSSPSNNTHPNPYV